MISKKTLYGTIIAVIIVFAIIMIYLNNPWKPSTNNVQIVQFSKEEGAIVGEQMTFPYVIKVENFGSNDVSGLIVVVKLLGDYSELDSETKHLSTLESGHYITFGITLWANTDDLLGKEISHVATLYLGNSVIDEVTLP